MNELFRYLHTIVKKNGPVAKDYPRLDSWFDQLVEAKNNGILNDKDFADLRKIWGDALSIETCQGFSFLKPHGYAGDYEIIDKLYTKHVSPDPRLARWDEYYHHHDAARAVRNRCAYLKKLIETHLGRKKKLKILNIGSGPGRDMQYFFQKHAANGSRGVRFECLEQDEAAIAFARHLCRDYLAHISFVQDNILRCHLKNQYDVIWASGIFDYFNDRLFARILGKLVAALAPHGECVIGNFSTGNPTQSYMEILGWHLYHRTPERLRALAGECGVPKDRISISRDRTGVNLFLHVKK
jgi:extracellular factor (EF) 3-hydroxypalmitic acid methyl ester biosynthesis protein